MDAAITSPTCFGKLWFERERSAAQAGGDDNVALGIVLHVDQPVTLDNAFLSRVYIGCYYVPLKGCYNALCVPETTMPMRVFHGRQIAAARALANVSTRDLAAAAGVTARTVGRLEEDGTLVISPRLRHGHVTRATFDKLKDALARLGVELLAEDEHHGAGVRWIRPRTED